MVNILGAQHTAYTLAGFALSETTPPHKAKFMAMPRDPNVLTRPLLFTDADEFAERVDSYFDSISVFEKVPGEDINGNPKTIRVRRWAEPPTLSGLAVYLNTTRVTLFRYFAGEHINLDSSTFEAIRSTLIRARSICESYDHRQLHEAKSSNGTKFSLINNYGWEDKVTTELKGSAAPQNDLSRLSEAELVQWKRLVEKTTPPPELPSPDSENGGTGVANSGT